MNLIIKLKVQLEFEEVERAFELITEKNIKRVSKKTSRGFRHTFSMFYINLAEIYF